MPDFAETTTPLMKACEDLDYKKLLELIAKPETNVNFQDSSGQTALMKLIITQPWQSMDLDRETHWRERTRLDMVKKLLSCDDVNLNIQDKNRDTAFILASRLNNINISEELLSSDKLNISLKNNKGEDGLRQELLNETYRKALEHYNLPAVKKVVRLGADINYTGDFHYNPPMFTVLANNDVETAKYLLSEDKFDINQRTKDEVHPLGFAIKKENPNYELIQSIALSPKTDINYTHLGFNNTLLQVIRKNDAKIFDIIAQNDSFNINVLDISGRSSLTYAMLHKRHKVFDAMLKHRRCDVNYANPQTGNTTLMAAAANNQCEAIGKLLDNKADVNITNKDGLTALDFAIQNMLVYNEYSPAKALLTKAAFLTQTLIKADIRARELSKSLGVKIPNCYLRDFQEAKKAATEKILKLKREEGVKIKADSLEENKTAERPKRPRILFSKKGNDSR